MEEIASAAHEFQKWNHWSRNSTPGAWKIFLGGKKMWWPHGSHLGCLMLAHSAFLGLVVVVVFSDGGAQNHIFGYIIGISHFHFLPFFLIYFMKALLMLQIFWPKEFPQICQKFGKKWRKRIGQIDSWQPISIKQFELQNPAFGYTWFISSSIVTSLAGAFLGIGISTKLAHIRNLLWHFHVNKGQKNIFRASFIGRFW